VRLNLKNTEVELEETFLILLITCVISNMARSFFVNYLVCLLFITFHEMSHLLVASIFGLLPIKIKIRTSGLMLEYNALNINRIKWLLIYASGPLSNLVLAVMFKDIKIVYEVNLALFLINLVPIKPLDGYNVLTTILINKNEKGILKIIEKFTKIGVFFLSMYSYIKYKNPSMFILFLYISCINLNNLNKTKNYNIRY
jgi:Zn-dependent protease